MADEKKEAEPEVIIHADTREEQTAVFRILAKHSDLRKNLLAVADYQLSEQVCVERKTVSDFLQSLIDGRLFEQLKNMKNSFSKPILLIEGEEDLYSERNIHPNAIRGALAAIATDFQVPIIWTKNQLETAKMIYAIARREQLMIRRGMSIREKIKPRSLNQEQEFLVAGLPSISGVLAKRLLKHFGTPEKVFAASEGELREVEGIGEKLAKRIREVLKGRYEKSILE